MRRLLCLALAAALCLSLCACSGGADVGTEPSRAPTTEPTEAPVVTPKPRETPEPTPEATPEPTQTPKPTESPAPEGELVLEVALEGETLSLPAYLFEGALLESGERRFSCLLPTEGVETEYRANAWYFSEVSDPEVPASLELSFIAGADGESLLPGLMDSYLDFTDVEFSTAPGFGTVRETVAHATAADGACFAEGWLLDVAGGVISAVLVCPLDKVDREGRILTAVLDSFAIS